jgi:hypothetical protein
MEIEVSQVTWLDENFINVCYCPKHPFLKKKVSHYKEFEVSFDNYEQIIEQYNETDRL